MNKLIIGLLVIAAGTGVYFLLNKQKTSTAIEINKELLTGKWKSNQLDSGVVNHSYDFQKEGTLIEVINDSIIKDSSQYAWEKEKLVWKADVESVGQVFSVVQLTKDSLQLQAPDSSIRQFIRTKP